jgi:3-oxoacyl-[acyl-carrier protein] reductase
MNKVFITGSTSGLGRAIAEKFLAEGKIVYLHGRNPNQVRSLLKNGHCTFFRHDLLNLEQSGQLADFVIKENIDCFINNAGIYSDQGTSLSPRGCAEIINTNLLAPLLILNKVYNYYRKKQNGIIVNINSIAGIAPNFNESAYCASKYGIKGFIEALQLDGYKHNIRIMEYYLGAIQTRMTKTRKGFDDFMKPGDIARHIYDSVTAQHSFVVVRQELRKAPSANADGG